MEAVTGEGWLLLSWVLAGAAWLVAHVAVVWLALSARELSTRLRLLSLLPPAAPVVAWVAGRRVAPVLWGVLLVTYAGLRMLE